jgi:hypothetical protein
MQRHIAVLDSLHILVRARIYMDIRRTLGNPLAAHFRASEDHPLEQIIDCCSFPRLSRRIWLRSPASTCTRCHGAGHAAHSGLPARPLLSLGAGA